MTLGQRQGPDLRYDLSGAGMHQAVGTGTGLGAASNDAGDLIVDAHQRTAIPGLYAAGDIINELNQIAVAFGHAAIAASDIHN